MALPGTPPAIHLRMHQKGIGAAETRAVLQKLERREWASQVGYNVIFTEAGMEAALDPNPGTIKRRPAKRRLPSRMPKGLF